MSEVSSMADTRDLQAMVREWARANMRPESLDEAEKTIQIVTRQLGQVMLEEAMVQAGGKKTHRGPRVVCECGAGATFVAYRRRWVRTLCGEAQVERAYYHCQCCRDGYAPWDREQGLNQRQWSPGVKAMAVEVCGRLHYREGALLIERLTGIRIEESSLEQIVAEVGQRLREADAEAMDGHFSGSAPVVSERKPRRLYISMDGTMAHIGGDWHEVKTAVVYQGEPTGWGEHPDWDRALRGRYVAAQETAEEFGKRVYLLALMEGLESADEVVALGDGAEWIRHQVAMHFSRATCIVDYMHACEHIWTLARRLYGEESVQGKRWATDHCNALKVKGSHTIIRALRRRKAKGSVQQEAVRQALGYFERNRDRMDYPAYRARGLMIGSGPVEAGCKVVVGQRLKQPGMRWSPDGADNILAARTTILNGEYDRIELLAHSA